MQYILEYQNTDEKRDISLPQKTLSPFTQKANLNIAGPYMIRYFKILFHVFQPQPTKENCLLHHFLTIKFFIGENQPVPMVPYTPYQSYLHSETHLPYTAVRSVPLVFVAIL